MDIINKVADLKVVLVLESPYKDELIHNHPLAGKSGKAVTDYINRNIQNSPVSGINLPIGCFLKVNNFTKLGIINSSWLPLDETCYPCGSSNIIKSFNLIRRNPKSGKRKNRRSWGQPT